MDIWVMVFQKQEKGWLNIFSGVSSRLPSPLGCELNLNLTSYHLNNIHYKAAGFNIT